MLVQDQLETPEWDGRRAYVCVSDIFPRVLEAELRNGPRCLNVGRERRKG